MYIIKEKTYFKIIIAVAFFLCIFFYYITRTVPSNFPVGRSFTVEEGETLHSISLRLEGEHYIYSALLFRMWVSSLGSDRHVQLGVYTFGERHVLGYMVKKFISMGPDMPLASITVPEGSTSNEIASIIHRVIPSVSTDLFKEKISTKNGEGKLFPSTYYLLPSVNEDKIIDIMLLTFEKKWNESFKGVKFPSPLTKRDEVINLASILEGEAKTKKDMQMVAGILIKRLSIGMPLQVDVARETYKNKGLPFQPVNNPGLVAIYAALNPTDSEYLYYITGNDGTMHYAKTFAEHKANIKKYL